MPELKWDIGYPFALATIVLSAFLVWRRLKKAGWI
jgi:Mg2+ and Co2+ transporter CorA